MTERYYPAIYSKCLVNVTEKELYRQQITPAGSLSVEG